MANFKKGTFAEKESRYETPLLKLLNIESSEIICQSGSNDDFNDNTNPVDWFN